ncbi:invasin domain 3-containing protein [Aquirufa aurantiipilula]|uniref:Invasin domain 3-containing protein n=4 Tax=Aquirufa aurantiipilula TaxID=2696561 RepID=A0ABT6BI68_9BACT|nr:invasin domain 3-containing protein [Aquirufa aurantiipilula]MDF5690152.1 invasin domain 3-containing protein [Aquirufa aurantiipilula]
MKVSHTTYFKTLKHFPSLLSILVLLSTLLVSSLEANGLEKNTTFDYPKIKTSTELSLNFNASLNSQEGWDVLFFDQAPGKTKSPEELRIIQANKEVNKLLFQLFQKANYQDLLFSYFPGNRSKSDIAFTQKVEELKNAVLNKGFNIPVQLLNWSVINGAMAAYANHGPTGKPIIYFNEEYVAHQAPFFYPKADDNQMTGLLLQEYGHAIDFFLNGESDSPGDEGALFAAQEMGYQLDSTEIKGIQLRNDSNRILVYGKSLHVEEAALVTQTIWPATISSNKVTINGAKVSGSNFRFETVCTGGGSNCNFSGTTGGGSNSVVNFSYLTTGGSITSQVRGVMSWRDQSGSPNSVFFDQYSSGSTTSGAGYVVVLLVNATTNAYTSTSQISGNSGPVGTTLDNFAVANTPTTGNSTIVANPTTGVVANNTSTSTLTVTAKNSSNAAIAGATVTISQFSDSGLLVPTTKSSISPASATTDALGVATFTVTSTVAPQTIYYRATVVASGFETILSNNASIGFVTGSVAKLQVLMPGETADPGSLTGKTGTPTDQVAGSNTTVTVNAVDAWWNKVTSATPTVAITTSDPNDTHPSNATLTAGTGTFTGSFRTAGNQTVTATDQAATLTANTGATTLVTAGTVNKLQVIMPGETAAPGTATGKTGTPTAQTAGTSLNFTVNAVDAYWNLVSSATPTAVITSSDGQATLPSSAALASGTKQFALTFKTAGNQTITATDQAATLTANTGASTVVNAGAASKLSFSVQPNNATANSSISPAIKVRIEDANGNLINTTANVTLAIGTNLASGTLSGTLTQAAVAGEATFSNISINNIGTGYTLSATSSGLTGATSSNFNITPGAADATASTLTPTSASITANGSSTQVLTVTAKDANGNNLTAGGATVTITKASGTGTIGSVTDNGNGTYTATVTSPTATGSGVFVATLGAAAVKSGTGSQTQSTITYTPGAADATASTLTPTSASITANGSSTQVLTVTAKDVNGNNLTAGGATVTITKSSGSGTIGSVTDNGNGTYTATVTSPTATGSGVFVATLGGAQVKSGTGSQTQSTITYTPGAADATASTLTPTSASITANGSSTQVLTVTAKDANGNNLTAGGATVTITKSSGTGTIGSVTDNGNGTYTATVTSPTATGSGVFVATLGGAQVKSGTGSQTQSTITYIPGAADATASTLTPTSASITANGSSTQVLTVTAKDANGNNLTAGGATVTITKSSGTGTIGSVTDNGNGTYTATVTSPTATGSGIFVATLGGAQVKSGTGSQTQSTIIYTPGAADATVSTLTPTSASITANGSSTQILTVTAKDANGNNLTAGGATVTITQSSGTGTIGSVTDNSNGTYTATVTSPTAAGSGVFVATLGAAPVKNGTGSQTQSTITYTAGVATKLVVSNIAQQTAGTGFAVTVTLTDVNGNPVLATADGTVTLTLKTGTGTLGGTLTGTILSGNSAVTISGVTYTKAETGVVLTATGSLAGNVSGKVGDSNAFNVVAGAADATASTLTPTSASITANGSSTQVLTVTAKDANGNNLTAGGATVTITKSSGTGTIGSVTDNGNGTYTATVTSPTATGSGVFVATLGAAPVKSGTGSQTQSTITYIPGAADAAVSTLTPTSASITANGSSTQILTVTAKDANGNNLTAGGATVTITKSSGTGTIGSVTDNGNGTYTATVTSPTATGSGVFVATLGAAPVKNGTGSQTQSTITYTAGVATKLVVSNIAQQTAGTGFAVTVTLTDVNGNAVNATADGTVTLTLKTGNGTLGGTLTGTILSGNSAVTISGVTYTKAETGVVLTATGSLAGNVSGKVGDSNAFNVVAGAATQLAISNISTQTAGSGFAVTVTLLDANGNTVNATADGTVTLTLKTGTGTLGGTLTGTITSGTSAVTISGVTYTKAESGVVLTATGSAAGNVNGKTGDSNSFTVNPGAVDATKSTITPVSASIIANGSSTQLLTVTAKDANGNNVGTGGATVTISRHVGTGVVGSVSDVGNGTYTATVTSPTTVGTGQFEATIGGNVVENGTGAMFHSVITYTVGPAAKLTFQVQPSNTASLASINPAVKVRIEDTNGNLTSSTANVTINFGTNAGSGTLSGTKTVAAINGVATFSDLSIDNAANGYTLSATSSGLTGATSNTFNVSTSGAAKLAFSVQPSNATAGSSISPAIKVQILDAAGNPTTATDNITLSIDTNPASGTLSGTLTQAAVAGEATFSGISINKSSASAYKLKATSGSLTETISSTFIISPNTPTAITVTNITPAVGILGINNNIVRVNLVDAYGNFSPAPSDIGVELGLFIGATDRTSDGIERTNSSNVVQSTPIQTTITTGNYYTDVTYVRYKVSTIDKTTTPYTVNTNATIKAAKYSAGGPSLSTGTSSAFIISEGKIYSPKTTGNWNAVTWAISSDGGTSFADTAGVKYTYDKYDIVKIPTGITTTLSQDVSLYSMIIDGTFDLTTNGTLTLYHHSGIDGEYNVHTHGTFKNSGGTFTNTNESGSGFLPNFHGGTYWHARDGGVIPKALWTTQAAGALTKITGLSSTSLSSGFDQAFLNFEWDNSYTGQSMHGNVSVAKDFYLKSGSFSIGDNNTLTLNETVNGSSGGKLKGTTLSTLHVNTTSGSPTLDFASGGQNLKELKVNVTGGTSLTIPSDLNINNTLNLVSGHLVMGNNKKIILPSNASITGASDTRYVEGTISRVIPKQTDPSVSFPIGDASAYTPVTLDFVGRSAASTDLTIESSTNSLADNTSVNGSGIRGDKYVKRKWRVTDGSGTTANGFTTYNITLGFPSGDIVGSASLSNMIVRKNSGSWKAPNGHVRTDGTTKTIKGQSFNSFSDFFVGESTGATSFTLNSPADITAGTRAAYVGTRVDAASLPYTTGAQTAYLTSTGSGVFYDAASGGNVITSIDFADGSSTVNFWFEKNTVANYTITMSDATPADAGAGVVDATDDIAVTVGAVDAATSTLTPTVASITANGTSTQVLSVTAKDAYGNNRGTGGDVVTITQLSGTGTIGTVSHAGSGVYTATVTSPTSTGTGVFVATLGGAQVKNGTGTQTQSTITYSEGAASKLVITNIGTKTAGATFDVIVTLTDANGNPVNATANGTVTLSLKTGTGTLGGTLTGTITAGGSDVTFTGITYTKAETGVVLTATGSVAGNVSGKTGDSNAFTVVAGAADAAVSTLTPTSASIVADGSTQVLVVTAKDANGNNLTAGGATVTITKSSGSGTIGSVTDNGNGTYSATVTAPNTAGSGVFVATLGAAQVKSGTGSQTQSTITYTAGSATKLVVSNIVQQTAGTGFAVTVTLTDANGNPVNATLDGTVTLTRKTGTGTLGGTVTGTMTAGTSAVTISGVTYTKAETGVVLTATGSVAGNVNGKTGDSNAFTVVAGAATKYIVTSSNYAPVVGGTVTITAQLVDANNNPVSTSGKTVTWSKSNANGSFSSGTSTTDASGTATVTFTAHTVANTVTTITATDNTTLTGTTPNITSDASGASKLVVTNIAQQTAGNGFAVTVTLTDDNGNVVNATANGIVTLTRKTGTGTLGGTVTGTITSGTSAVTISGVTYTKAETGVVLTATGSDAGNVNGKIGDSNAFTVVAGAADATASTLTPTSASIVADGSTQVLVVTAKDANGNNLTAGGATVTITKSSGSGTIGSVSDNGNGTYSATVTAPNVAGSGVFVATLGAAQVKNGTGSQTQSTITYTAGTATKLVVTNIAQQTAGTGFSVTVTLTDANNNPVNATLDGTVTLTRKTGTGTLGGTVTGTITTGTSAVTISGVTYTKAETGVVLTATGSVAGNVSGKTGDSNAFTVVAGAAAKYIVTSSSTSPAAGGTVTITAQLVDANNNPVSTSGQTITWSKSNANGSFSSGTSTTDASGTATVTFTAHTVAGTSTTITATDNTNLTGTTATITAGSGNASKLVVTNIAGQTAGTAFAVTVTLTDDNGNAVNATADATITLTRKTGTGTLGGTLTGTITSGTSVVTISGVTYTKAETGVVLTATGSGSGNASGKTGDSNSFNVSVGAADAAVSTLTPTSASIVADGSTQVLVVTAKDANGNNLTAGGATVTITKSSGTGTIGSVTDNGNGTYSATVTAPTAAGSGVFVATLGAAQVKSGTGSQTQSTITYTAGTASKLVITNIAQQTAGTDFAVTVTLTDANGNPVNATANGTVTLTLKTGTSLLGGTLTGTITSGSSAVTISGVSYTKAETGVSLTATGSGSGNVSGKTGDSNTFTVVPGTASKYIVTSSSTSPAAGGTVTITAQLVDAYNNSVSTSGKTVTWSKSDVNGSFSSSTSTTDANGTATVTFTTHAVAGTSTTVTATDNTSLTGTTPSITSGSGGATKLVVSTISGQTAGTAFAVTVTLTDGNGNAVNASTNGTVTLTLKSGNGTLGGTLTGTITSGTSAVTISGVTYTKAEAGVSLTATGSGSGNVVGKTGDSNTFSVVAGAGAKYIVTSSNTSPTAGGTVTITAQLVDANNNPVTTSGKTVTWSKSDANGSFSSATSTTDANGIATVTYTTHTVAGTSTTITATDNNNLTGTSAGFSSTSGAASKLVVGTISGQSAGTAFPVTITLTDANGNPVNATANGTVTISLKTGTGTLGGTLTGTINAGSSAVTISGLTYTKLESGVVLTATGSGAGNVAGKSGDSNAFNVSAGGANRFIISTITDKIALNAFSLTATLVDANGNLVNADVNTTVTVSVKTGTGILGGTLTGSLVSGSSSVTISGITYDKVESGVELKATATSAGNTNGKIGNSNAFAVSAGIGSKIKLSPLSNYVAGTSQTITATLTDENDNTVLATANSTITLSVKTGTGTITGTYTGIILAGSSSVTITGVVYNKAETGIVLRATGTGAGSNVNGKVGDSNAFTVSPGPLYRYFISGLTRQEAGTTQTITIRALDQYDNVIPSYAGLKPITFTGASAASEIYKPSAGAPTTTPTSVGGGTGTLNQTVKKTTQTTTSTTININATAAGNTVVQNPGSNIISLNATVSTLAEFGSTVNLTFTNGIANAVIILYKAETATISATDGVVNTPKEGELQVEVVSSSFAKLEVTLAPQQVVGQPLVGSLKALDQYGNVVKNFDASQNNITIVVNNLTGTVTGLSGTIKLTSPTDFVNGVADFSLLGVKYQGGSGSGGFTFTPTTGASVQAENIVVVADDVDGDGVSDEKEATDGTDKNDPCSYLLASQDFSKTTLAWKSADCDGDGTTNGTDAAPLNSCIGGIPGYIPVKGSLGYQRYFLGDCDGDGITNDMECYGGYTGGTVCQDFDSDGIPNSQDPDSDNDGILDIVEKNIDSDGDGDANYLDLDSDNDGILDIMEKTGDTDGDSIPNYLDTDSDGDGIMDAWEATNSTRGVIDTNYDGRVDSNGAAPDANGNGLVDFLESNPAPIPDTDKDGTPDYLDLDSDGDAISDKVESTGDSDKDGKPNYRDKDSDGDWLGDTDERDQDNDRDGIPNYLDLDSDGDTIPDAWEGKNKCATCDNKNDDNDDGWDDRGQYKALIDTDKDGSPDFFDLDSDNDCIPDRIELGADGDGDELANFRDLDSDGDGIPDQVESVVCDNLVDTDKDGTKDFEDLDSDGDGIPDTLEAGATPTVPMDSDKDGLADYRDTDSDGDGILDIYEAGNNPKTPVDSDKDGKPDYLDADSDGDGIPDQIEGGGAGFKPLDSDNDGIEDYRDLDSDNDTIPDKVEAGVSPSSALDTDQDGNYDFRDTDSDGDGLPDKVEVGPDVNNPMDTDKDGKADYIDTDSDNDSIPDRLEVGSDPNKPVDSDGDGIPNYRDTDSDNDTILDSYEVGPDALIPSDFDKDGLPDYIDSDSDNDSIPDKVEVGANAAAPIDTDKDGIFDYRDTDSDNDGLSDKVEAGSDPNRPVDSDKDGLPDYRDVDSDNDGIPDKIEVGKDPNNPVDTDRDGIPDFRDTDSDNDGTPDSIGAGSNLNTPLDTDKDGIYDYLDPDDDNDRIPDLLEDDLNYGAMPDCDNDGIPNRLDPDTCDTFVPQGISPNNDGFNDKLVIPGILNFRNRLSIYNRWGDLVFETENYKNDWGGESSPNNVLTIDKKLPDGVYYYVVDFFGVKPNISSYVFINRTALDR